MWQNSDKDERLPHYSSSHLCCTLIYQDERSSFHALMSPSSRMQRTTNRLTEKGFSRLAASRADRAIFGSRSLLAGSDISPLIAIWRNQAGGSRTCMQGLSRPAASARPTWSRHTRPADKRNKFRNDTRSLAGSDPCGGLRCRSVPLPWNLCTGIDPHLSWFRTIKETFQSPFC